MNITADIQGKRQNLVKISWSYEHSVFTEGGGRMRSFLKLAYMLVQQSSQKSSMVLLWYDESYKHDPIGIEYFLFQLKERR